MSSRRLRRALASSAILLGTPFVVLPLVSARQGGLVLALAGSALLLAALALEHRLLPGVVLCFAGELVLLVSTHAASPWSAPPLAAALFLVYELAALRERTPEDAYVETRALRLVAIDLTVAFALALGGAFAALAAAAIPAGGGAEGGVIGTIAAAAVLLLVSRLAAGGRARAGATGSRE